tara:strand:- start:55 stop:249 length:195 start_codon:yes stop_codon:yes gene_type:complete
MGIILAKLCQGVNDPLNDYDFNPDTQDIITKMNEYLDRQREKKDMKLKKIEHKIHKNMLKKLFK